MDNFDVYEWNKNRYLNKIEEGMGPKQATMKLDQLTFNVVKSMFGEIPMFGIGFPNPDDSYRSVFSGDDLESWKAGIRERYGNVNIRIDVEAANRWDRIQILDDKFRADKERRITGKAAWLDKERQAGRTSGLDEGDGLQLVHVYDKDGKIYGTGSVEKVEGDKTFVRFDGSTVKRFPSDKVKPVKEEEKDGFAGSDPKSGSTIQGTGFNWKPKVKK